MFSFLNISLYAAPKDNFTVVIDAGHGGKDAGACEGNHREKDINLGVALKLGRKIKKNLKDVNVVYTRSNDCFISLQGRADKANRAKGNLFISIHTNSLDKNNKNRTSAAGSSVYVLGLHKDKNNMAVARRENSVIKLEKGYEENYGFDPNSDESYIIFEMAQKKNLSQSIRFADEVQRQLVKTAGRRDRGVHQAGFWVLWATSMPAILVELDFICNTNSAIFMTSEKGQDKLAESIYNAFKNYYEGFSGKKRKNYKFESVGMQQSGGNENTEVVLAVADKKPSRKFTEEKVPVKHNIPIKRRRRSVLSKKLSDSRSLEAPDLNIKSGFRPLTMLKRETGFAKSENIPNKNLNSHSSRKQNIAQIKKKKKRSSGRVHKAKIENYRMVYSIQLLESDSKLNQNNKMFCGLNPVRVIKEHNRYKYLYGENEDRSILEKLLKGVKNKIPGAIIIKNIRRVVSK